jgi:predicted DNA-binding transcriptional regulator YafY
LAVDYTRIHRLLRILTLLQAESGWNARRLADKCATSERNIYRDLQALEGAGIPYHFDETSDGYRIRRDFFMPPVELTLEESLALTVLAQHVAGDDQVPFTAPADRAIEKVRSQLPAPVREPVEQMEAHVAVHLAKHQPGDGTHDVYQQMRRAIAERRALECRYESVEAANRGEDTSDEIFVFHPYRLFFAKRAWYAVGYHGGRDAVRKLKLSRFIQASATDKPYQIPEDFDLDAHLGHAWRMIRGEERYDIELWFAPEFAETIEDTRWHSTQHIEPHDDGSITFRCRVDGLDEIVWWVLSMGPYCVVKHPAALVERVHELARRTAERYEP